MDTEYFFKCNYWRNCYSKSDGYNNLHTYRNSFGLCCIFTANGCGYCKYHTNVDH